jgi:hypothetical protein
VFVDISMAGGPDDDGLAEKAEQMLRASYSRMSDVACYARRALVKRLQTVH